MAEPTLVPGPHWQTAAGGHPDEQAWERLACGELTDELRRSLLDHVVDCAECTRVYRALAELERGARRFDPGVPRPGLARWARRGRLVWRWGLGGAVAAAAAAVLAVWIGVRPPAPEPAPSPPEALRSGSAAAGPGPVLLAPLGAVTAPPELAWEPVAGAQRYRLELLDAEGEIVWTATTAGTSVPWPAAVPRRPGRYYWRVIAELERGGTVASALEDFDVAGPAGGEG
jgi:hypothetical protein